MPAPYFRQFRILTFSISFILLFSIFSTPVLADEETLHTDISFAEYNAQKIIVLKLTIPEGYHVYAPDSSEGYPTQTEINTPEGEYTVFYQKGESPHRNFSGSGPIYKGNTYIFISSKTLCDSCNVSGTINALLCSDKKCIPQHVSFQKKASSFLSASNQPWFNIWLDTVENNKGYTVRNVHKDDTLIPTDPVPLIPITSDSSEISRLGSYNFSPVFFYTSTEVQSMLKAILLGFVAGLILNIMPCVLPVLTLKMNAILLSFQQDNTDSLKRFREYNLFFSLGIIAWFAALAFIFSFTGLMWGELYQNTTVVILLLLLVFMLGLSTLGVFTLPMLDLKISNDASVRTQAFITGLLATLLATPCSGPLLGGVLSWSMMQPISQLATVFCFIGIGMAFPYIICAFYPKLIQLLPRPGSWMAFIEKILGFFLLGSSIYLFSILPAERHIYILSSLLVIAMASWIWGTICTYNSSKIRNFVGRSIGSVLVCLAVMCSLISPEKDTDWKTYSSNTFANALGNTPILVEFTADWCPNCKFLEASVLSGYTFTALCKKYDLTIIRADMTQESPEIKNLLESLGARSLPTTAIFPTGERSKQPLVLRDVYSSSTLSSALRQVFEETSN